MSTAIALRACRHLLRPVEPKEVGGLYSFHYFKDTNLGEFLGKLERNGHRPEVFTDSGGFSAFSQGVVVELDDYVRFLLRWRSVLDHYANLDVIGDPRASLRNLLRMEQRGLRPVPVIHVGTDPEEVRRHKARGYSYQCLGGMVPHLTAMSQALRRGTPSEVVTWARACHEVAHEEGVKLHGFGATNFQVMLGLPWHSVDSSSWAAGFRFGNVYAFDPVAGKWVTMVLRDTQGIMRQAALLRFYGVDPLSLVKDGMDSRVVMITVAARSFLVALRWLRARGRPGFQIYLADSVAAGTDARIYSLALSRSPEWVD